MGAELDRFPPGVLELRARVGRDEVAGLDPLEPVFLERCDVDVDFDSDLVTLQLAWSR
jgi:hypothetical protein